jgi:DNA repair exonuclease SbcCD nuclease subunit
MRRDGEAFGIAPETIIAAGDSAGGQMSASLAMYLRDRGLPKLAAQVTAGTITLNQAITTLFHEALGRDPSSTELTAINTAVAGQTPLVALEDVAVALCGHVHRHQVLRPADGPPVIYAGSVERTSFAEAPEAKGFVVLQLTRSGLGPFEFRPLPARPMVRRTLFFGHGDSVEARLAAAIESTPDDAVVQLRVAGAIPAALTAAALRAIAGARTVTLAIRTADRRFRR